jgi:hypothetical protein
METVKIWHPAHCACVMHVAVDLTTGAQRSITREEALDLHLIEWSDAVERARRAWEEAGRPVDAPPTPDVGDPAVHPLPVARLCLHHEELYGTALHQDTCREEGFRHQQSILHVIDQTGIMLTREDRFQFPFPPDATQEELLRFHPGALMAKVHASFDAERVLHVSLHHPEHAKAMKLHHLRLTHRLGAALGAARVTVYREHEAAAPIHEANLGHLSMLRQTARVR